MNELTEQSVGCPYCGESIAVLVDVEEAGQRYIEDCQVCCRPIVFSVSLDGGGGLVISAHDENEAI